MQAYTLPGIKVSSAISNMPAKTTQRTPTEILFHKRFLPAEIHRDDDFKIIIDRNGGIDDCQHDQPGRFGKGC